MARMTIGKGLDEFIRQCGDLQYKVDRIAGRALYAGAGVLADAMRSEIEALPVAENKHAKTGRRNPTQVEKEGLLKGLGTAKKQQDGDSYNISIGFDGYNEDRTEKWPNGKPNAMIANSINAGTTFMRPNKFKNRAANKAREKAEAAAIEEVEKQIKEIMVDG